MDDDLNNVKPPNSRIIVFMFLMTDGGIQKYKLW